MFQNILMSPPVVFIIVLIAVLFFAFVLSRFAFVNKHPGAGQKKCYACGEDVKNHRIKPDYSQFFPFAFFFTIIHVVALMVSTVPAVNTGTLAIALLYIFGMLIGLSILFRRSR
jgi:NADH:ubiquinone oxidoreductase subunit 3 (subunit A)